MHDCGLALRMPPGNRDVALVKNTRQLPLFGKPRHLSIPGGLVALVQAEGRVVLTARAVRLTGPTKVRLVDGKTIHNGYLLHLTKIQQAPEDGSLNIRWRVVGQIRYFDIKRWAPTIVGEPVERSIGTYLDDSQESSVAVWISSRKFSGGIPGLPRSAPEAKLVDGYVAWLRAESEFEQDYLRSARLFTDLFDRSFWRLLEAKAHTDRRTLRTAVGQLFDYKRFYARTPSLGILVPSRPSSASLDFLRECGVTAVWRTPSGRFCDSSSDRGWSSNRRRTPALASV